MPSEFDILNGFISPDVKKQFDELNKYAEQSAEKMKALAAEKDKIFGSLAGANTGGGTTSKIQEKLEADLKRANEKIKGEAEKHKAKMVELEKKYLDQVNVLKERHSNSILEAEQRFNNQMAKEKEKLNAKLYELELKINSASDAQREKYEAEAVKSQQQFNDRLALERQKLSNKIAEIEANELVRQKDYDKRRADSLADRAAREAAAAQRKANKPAPLDAQGRVDKASIDNVTKLNAILTSQYTTALEKNDAQMRLNVIAAQKYVVAGDTQNKEYLSLIANTKKLSEENIRLAKASGQTMAAHSSMYGSTYSLTQVMRELPNFAIDARIGFMALSNNLPMLMDDFSRLSKEIDHVTGKEKGFKGALKEFGKSLLSLNTIMIVVSTLLVLFGDDIVNFIGKIVKAPDAIDRTSESLKALIKTTSDYNGQAASTIKSVTALGIQIDKFGGETEHTDAIVAEFNKTFDTHLTTIEQVKLAYPKMADAAIQAAIRMQASMSLIERASNAMLDAQNARLQLSSFKKEDVDAAYQMGSKLASLAEKLGYSKEELNKNIKKGEGFDAIGVASEAVMNTRGAGNSPNFDTYKEFNTIFKEFKKIQGENTIIKVTTQLGDSQKKLALWTSEASKLAEPLKNIEPNNPKGKTERTKQEKDMSFLFPESIVGKIKDIQIAPIGVFTPPINELAKAIDTNLNYAADAYKEGAISFQDYETFKTMQLKLASENNIKVTKETNDKLFGIETEHQYNLRNLEREQVNATMDLAKTLIDIWAEIFAQQNELIDKQLKKDTEVNDNRLKDYEDETKAGKHTQKELSDYKERSIKYQQSLEDEAARKKTENDKKAFLAGQALALAQVWVNYAMAQPLIIAASAAAGIPTFGAGTAPYLSLMESLSLAGAIASSALIIAQTIPAFEHGGDVKESGIALVGEKRHELVYNKKTGKSFITPDKPTYMYLEKGMHVYPDINKLDLDNFNRTTSAVPYVVQDDRLLNKIDDLTRVMSRQKTPTINGMNLLQQLQYVEKNIKIGKGLMN